jgi:flagellar hook assembly protein FlgD
MTINPTTTASPITAALAAPGVSGQQSQSQVLGKDAFMQLLVTKMQNQDPTQPQDDSALLAQLAQFSNARGSGPRDWAAPGRLRAGGVEAVHPSSVIGTPRCA